MSDTTADERTQDWLFLSQFLPHDWQDQARRLGAFQRARGIPDPATLLRTLLIHLAGGLSLQQSAARAEQAGWCRLSAVALFKRLRAAEAWLLWLAQRLWQPRVGRRFLGRYRVCAVDATVVSEPASVGTDWRLHYVLQLADLQCPFFEVTDATGGETFRRLPVAADDLLLGDRVYGTPPGIAHVTQAGGQVLVRVNQKALPLYDAQKELIPLGAWLKSVRRRRVRQWPVWVAGPEQRIAGRLIVVKRSRAAAQRARAQLRKTASKKQKSLSREALLAAGYFFVFTTVPREELSGRRALALYRLRWQIELAFKRLKSIVGLGQLPKTSASSCRAWLYGKLLVALLLERVLESLSVFSLGPPAGVAPAQPLA